MLDHFSHFSPFLCRIKNKHGLRPIDLLPPPPPPRRRGAQSEPDDDAELEGTEAVRAALRRAEAEHAMTAGGPGNDDIASGESLLPAPCSILFSSYTDLWLAL
jgi:hypothetical protein